MTKISIKPEIEPLSVTYRESETDPGLWTVAEDRYGIGAELAAIMAELSQTALLSAKMERQGVRVETKDGFTEVFAPFQIWANLRERVKNSKEREAIEYSTAIQN